MTLFGALSFFITVVSWIPYVRSILARKTKPKRSSWFIWFSLDLVGLAVLFSTGKVNWLLIAFCMSAGMVAILSLKYGLPGWELVDTLSASAAVVAIGIWIAIGPAAGLICMLTGVSIGAIPTVLSVMRGNNEDLTAWLLAVVSTVFSLLDGNILVSIWYLVLQATVVTPVIYHKCKRQTLPIPG